MVVSRRCNDRQCIAPNHLLTEDLATASNRRKSCFQSDSIEACQHDMKCVDAFRAPRNVEQTSPKGTVSRKLVRQRSMFRSELEHQVDLDASDTQADTV